MSEELRTYIQEKFGVETEIFLQALKLSPNAQGYILGATTEFVLRDILRDADLEPKRIREKWDGPKHPNHRGDFYLRNDSSWFVLESKGLKSNSEKWHKLFNRGSLIKFLLKWSSVTTFTSEREVQDYISDELPKFDNDFSEPMYYNNEIKKYGATGRSTEKALRIEALRALGPIDVENQIAERVAYVRTKINVIEAHLVSNAGSSIGQRTQASPRVDEFGILSLDLFLRTGNHDFVFVDPAKLVPSKQDSDHLQQNYVVDVLVAGRKTSPDPAPPWSTKLEEVLADLGDGVDQSDMQVDERSLEKIAEDVDREEEP